MPNTGNKFPAVGENIGGIGSSSWSAPENAVSDNGLDAICPAGAGSNYLVLRNFGFALPAGATVNGITVRVEASEHSPQSETLFAQLQNDSAVLVGTTRSTSLTASVKAIKVYGGTADTWGAALTPAIVNSQNFGVRVWFTTGHEVRIDYVTLAVEYVLGVSVPLAGVPGSGTAGTAVAVVGELPEVGGPFPPGVFPGPIFPGPIFPGGPVSDLTLELPAVLASGTTGTIVPSASYPATVELTGVGAFVGSGYSVSSGTGGGVFPPDVFPGPIFPGEVFPGGGGETSVPIGGVGIVIPDTVVRSPAVEAFAILGVFSPFPDRVAELTGVGATADDGTVAVDQNKSVALTGVAATARAGTVTATAVSAAIVLQGVSAIAGTPGLGGQNAWGNSWGLSWGSSWGTVGNPAAWGTSWGESWGESWGTAGAVESESVGTVTPSSTVLSSGARANATNGLPAFLVPVWIKVLSSARADATVGFVTGGADQIASLTGVAATATAGRVLTDLVGNAATVAAGTVAASLAPVLSSAPVSATLGTLTPGRTKELASVRANATLGTLVPTVPQILSGVAISATAATLPAVASSAQPNTPHASALAGTLIATRVVGLSGVAASATAGESSVTTIDLLAVRAQAQVGFITAGADRVGNLVGVEASATAGTIAADADRSAVLAGVAVNATVGTLTANADRSAVLSGVVADVAVATPTPNADREAALNGVGIWGVGYYVTTGNDVVTPVVFGAVSSVIGSFLDIGNQKQLGGLVANVTAANVFASPDRTTGITQVRISVAAGAVQRDAIPLTGVGISADAGSVVETAHRVLPSVLATAKAGFAPKEGDIILETVGVTAGAGGIGVLGVGPIIPFGIYRHGGPRPVIKGTQKDLETLDREMALMEDK